MDMHEDDRRTLREWLADMEYAMLTTRAVDGSLASRPLQLLQLDDACDLWFFTARDSAKIDEIERDARVNVAFADSAKKRFVSVAGRASCTRDPVRIEALWSASQRVFFPRGRDDPALTVLRVVPEMAHIWDGNESAWGLLKKFGKAVLLHQASDLGRSAQIALKGD